MAVWQHFLSQISRLHGCLYERQPLETRVELLRLFTSHVRRAHGASWVATAMLAALMQHLSGGVSVLYWLLCKIPLSAIASVAVWRYARVWSHPATDHAKWRYCLLAAAACTGLSWGLGGAIMFSANPVHEMALAIVLCCVAAMATSLYAPLLAGSVIISSGIVIPSVVMLLGSDLLFYRLLGAAGIMFLLVLYWFALVTHRGLLRATTLVLDNQRLIELLSASNEHLELSNRDLRLRNVELAGAMNRIERLATTDELTGAANRRHFLELLRQHIATSLRFGTAFSIVAIDADHFKRVNDTYGHPAGDKALAELARVIREQIRNVDYLGRLGGEEFVCLLPHTSLAEASLCTERVRAAVERLTITHHGDRFSLTVSAGVTEHCPGESLERLMARADAALYAAKRGGRNRVQTSVGESVDVVKLLQAKGWLYRGRRATRAIALGRA